MAELIGNLNPYPPPLRGALNPAPRPLGSSFDRGDAITQHEAKANPHPQYATAIAIEPLAANLSGIESRVQALEDSPNFVLFLENALI